MVVVVRGNGNPCVQVMVLRCGEYKAGTNGAFLSRSENRTRKEGVQAAGSGRGDKDVRR